MGNVYYQVLCTINLLIIIVQVKISDAVEVIHGLHH